MTQAAMRRYQRRRAREMEQRRNAQIAFIGTIFIILTFLAFCLAGTWDYEDDQRELAYWAERGITIQRW